MKSRWILLCLLMIPFGAFAKITVQDGKNLKPFPMRAMVSEINRVSDAAIDQQPGTAFYITFKNFTGDSNFEPLVTLVFSGDDLFTASALKIGEQVVIQQQSETMFHIVSGNRDYGK